MHLCRFNTEALIKHHTKKRKRQRETTQKEFGDVEMREYQLQNIEEVSKNDNNAYSSLEYEVTVGKHLVSLSKGIINILSIPATLILVTDLNRLSVSGFCYR